MHVRNTLMTWALTAVVAGCGPELGPDDDPPGRLEYEIPSARVYRDDRRIEVVGVNPPGDSSGCGWLTDRAYEDIVGTIEQLDPEREYEWSGCYDSPDGLLYLEDFTHSPFECNWYCCHEDLYPIGIAYFAVVSTINGPDANINGEIYVALEPEVPCPE